MQNGFKLRSRRGLGGERERAFFLSDSFSRMLLSPPASLFRVESRWPPGETQFTPLKSIVLRGALQRGKRSLRRGRTGRRKRKERGGEQPVSLARAMVTDGAKMKVKPPIATFSVVTLILFFPRRVAPDENHFKKTSSKVI